MRKIWFSLPVTVFAACIGTDLVEDLVEERVIIQNVITSFKIGDSYQFRATYFDHAGIVSNTTLTWSSGDESVITIDMDGVATAVSQGLTTITVAITGASSSIEVAADTNTTTLLQERIATLVTVSSYPLSGDVTLMDEGDSFIMTFSDDFSTTSALPGLYVYLTNNPNSINNALEIARVKDFRGAQSYDIPVEEDFGLFTYNYVLFYCKPFVVPVGLGELTP